MPIALYAAPRVVEIIEQKFETKYNFYEPALHDEPVLSEEEETPLLVVQLDVQPNSVDKGLLPGLNWLHELLNCDRGWHRARIIVTTWHAYPFKKGSKSKLKSNYGVQAVSGLLNSPLITHIPLPQLIEATDWMSLFPAKMWNGRSSFTRLCNDLLNNCYRSGSIGLRCHRFRQLLGNYWQSHPEANGKEVYEYFRADLMSMFYQCSTAEQPLAIALAEPLRQFKEADNIVASKQAFNEIQLLLVASDKRPSPEDNNINTNILVITSDASYAAELQDVLSRFQVNLKMVYTAQEAVGALNEKPFHYSCVLSDYRLYQPDGKLAWEQGYEVLNNLKQEFPQPSYALLTSIENAYWSQPDRYSLPWLTFHKQTLRAQDSAQAAYFRAFLSYAEKTRQPSRFDFGDLFLGSKSVFKVYLEEYIANYGSIVKTLDSRITELEGLEKDFENNETHYFNWQLGQREFYDIQQYVCERFWYRLVLLCLLRSKGRLAEERPKERYIAVLEFLFGCQKDSADFKHRKHEITDFLRVKSSYPYCDFSLEQLESDGLIFPHEYEILVSYGVK